MNISASGKELAPRILEVASLIKRKDPLIDATNFGLISLRFVRICLNRFFDSKVSMANIGEVLVNEGEFRKKDINFTVSLIVREMIKQR